MVVLALLSVLIVGARNGVKTCSVNLADSTTVGSAQVRPGDYKVKLDGSQIVLIDEAGKRTDTPAKVEHAGHKFDATSIPTTKVGGTNCRVSMELGGTWNRVVFQ
jgi:biopolymer transport protein ExbD